jgi:hypothetical protein
MHVSKWVAIGSLVTLLFFVVTPFVPAGQVKSSSKGGRSICPAALCVYRRGQANHARQSLFPWPDFDGTTKRHALTASIGSNLCN